MMRPSRSGCCLIVLGFGLMATALDSHAQAVPGGARPGAVAPERDLQPPALPDSQRLQRDSQTLPEESTASTDVEVPPVADRPLDIDAGAVIEVTRFEMSGFTEHPQLEPAELQELLQQSLQQHQGQFTIGRLQQVADQVTAWYRQQGFILAQAFVPVQTVSDGVVQIEVLAGKLGRVQVEDNEIFDAALLQSVFAELQDQPVTKERIEAALLTLSDLPGLTLFGVFQPGQKVGDADMVLKVQEEERFEVSLRHDNHGQLTTGHRRTRVDFAWNNPTGGGDRLQLTAQQTQVPSNSFFQLLEYQRPLAPGTQIKLGFNKNAFDVGREFRERDIFSDTVKGFVSLERDFIRSREASLNGSVGLQRKTSRTKVSANEVSRDSLTVLDFSIAWDSVDAELAGLNSAYVQFSHGFNDLLGAMGGQGAANNATVKSSRRGGDSNYATGQFDKVFVAYSRLQSLTPVSESLKHHSVLLRTELQWSADMLVPLEQFSIGGPNSVRAYAPAEELFDKAYYLSVEYIINAPGFADEPAFDNYTWGQLLQFSVFFDTAAGRKNNPVIGTDVDARNYNGYGWSLSFNNPGKFSTRITLAYPVGEPEPADDRHPQFWMDLNFTF